MVQCCFCVVIKWDFTAWIENYWEIVSFMSKVDKLNKVIKNCQIMLDLLKILPFVTHMYEYYVLHITYSSLNKLTFKYLYWKKDAHNVPSRKHFWEWILTKIPGFALFLRYSRYNWRKKFSWTTSGEAILVPALAQSRADSEVRGPCLVELWISPRWPAPVLSHSLGNFSSPLRAVDISPVSACDSCTLLFHSMPLRIGFVFLNDLQIVGTGGGEWVPPLACSSSGWTNLTEKMMLSMSPMTWAPAPKASL